MEAAQYAIVWFMHSICVEIATSAVFFSFHFLNHLLTKPLPHFYCCGVERIPVVISVSSLVDSLMFARFSVFQREELRCIMGLWWSADRLGILGFLLLLIRAITCVIYH